MRYFLVSLFFIGCASARPVIPPDVCTTVCADVCDLAAEAVECDQLCGLMSSDAVVQTLCEVGCGAARAAGAAECPDQCVELVLPAACADTAN